MPDCISAIFVRACMQHVRCQSPAVQCLCCRYTIKRFDFLRLRHAKIIMERGEHLTETGLAKIRGMRSKMNMPALALARDA